MPCSTSQASVERSDGGELAGGWRGHSPAQQDNLQLHRDAGRAGSPRLQSPCGPQRPGHAGAPQPEGLSSPQAAMQILQTSLKGKVFNDACCLHTWLRKVKAAVVVGPCRRELQSSVTLIPRVSICSDWEGPVHTELLIRSILCTFLPSPFTTKWHLMLRYHMPAFERTTGHCFLTSKAT